MAASFSLTGTLRLDPRLVDDLNTTLVTDATRVNLSLSLTNGDGDGEADAYWRDVRTVAGGGADTISMATGLPLSVFGGSGTLELDTDKLRLLYVRNLSDTVTISLVLVDLDRLPVPPGGVLLLSRPSDNQFAGANAGDFEIHNASASAADYEILLIGVKAT